MKNYRLGLNITPSTIGWCAMEIKENGTPLNMLDWGVRLFNDGRDTDLTGKNIPGNPKASARTDARGLRRGHERTKKRRKNMLKQLVIVGLYPAERDLQKKLEKLNALELRNNAITAKLEPYEIGRALFHLQQSRGFKSNRKDAQQATSKELTGMKLGINNMERVLSEKYTLGQYLYKKNTESGASTKFIATMGEKKRLVYNFFISRKMVEDEFNAIWEAQKQYHPDLLNDASYSTIHRAIFYQRPLKPQPKGKCSILPHEDRMLWAMPSAQRFRIIKEINNLDFTAPEPIANTRLDAAQRKKLYNELCFNDYFTFKQIKKVLGLSSLHEFNLDVNGRERISGDTTAKIMRDEKRFGAKWDAFSLEEQDKIISAILNDDSASPDYMDDETLEYWIGKTYNVSVSQSKEIISSPLPNGVCAFGESIVKGILPHMLEDGMFERHAIMACGWKPYQEEKHKIYNTMPYYGEVLEKHVTKKVASGDPMVNQFGSVSNPSLHIALNQLRQLVNTLQERLGTMPLEITIQVDRNLKKGSKEITKIVKDIGADIKKKEKWRNEIERYKGNNQATKEDFLKMKLWEELAEDPMHRKCVYSGKTISISMLFSEQVQITHILPYSKTLDNTSANLIVVTTEGLYIKNSLIETHYQDVINNARNLPKSKQWRFREDAMEVFRSKAAVIESKSDLDGKTETIETGLDAFAVRPLRDTEYVAKLIRKYLGCVCLKGVDGVVATPGTLTGLFCASWGFNDFLPKDIPDHRKNAVNALAISLTNYFTVRKVAEAALLEERKGIRITKTLGNERPFASFDWEDLKERIEFLPSIKPDHGKQGKLHDDTFFGFVGEDKDILKLTVSMPFTSIIWKDLVAKKVKNYVDLIRDDALRTELCLFLGDEKNTEKGIEMLKDFAAADKINGKPNAWRNIKKVRIVEEKSSASMIKIKQCYVQGGSNHHIDVFCPARNNKELNIKAGQWYTETISRFNANQKDFKPQWRRNDKKAKLIMRLHANDLVAYEEDGKTEIRRVKKITTKGVIYLTPTHIAKEKADTYSWPASARQLQIKNARKLSIKRTGLSKPSKPLLSEAA